jgi:hypothetical protein
MGRGLTYIGRWRFLKSIASLRAAFGATGVIGTSARIGSGFAHPVKPYLRLVVAAELRHYPAHSEGAYRRPHPGIRNKEIG